MKRYLIIVMFALLGMNNAQGMLRNTSEERLRMQVTRLVNQRNINGLRQDMTHRANNGLSNGVFREVCTVAYFQLKQNLLLGLEPFNQETVAWCQNLYNLQRSSAYWQGTDVVNVQAVDPLNAILEYIRNNNPAPLHSNNQHQPDGVCIYTPNEALRGWLGTLPIALRRALAIRDIERINLMLRANFDNTHPGREQFREQILNGLRAELDRYAVTDEQRAQIQGFIDALPAVSTVEVVPNPAPQLINPQPVNLGNSNWFSNHKVATVLGVTTAVGVLSGLGYYLYTKWKKNKEQEKKTEHKIEETKSVNTQQTLLRRRQARARINRRKA